MNASVSVLSHKVVSQEEWLAARRELLREEKAPHFEVARMRGIDAVAVRL